MPIHSSFHPSVNSMNRPPGYSHPYCVCSFGVTPAPFILGGVDTLCQSGGVVHRAYIARRR